MSKLKLFKKVIMTTGGIALSASVASSATAADLTVASWGGSYQDAQSKALFVCAPPCPRQEMSPRTGWPSH